MQKAKFNIVTDGMWGSTGKGLICSALAYHYKPDFITNTNMANAGHTVVDNDGVRAFVAKALPSGAALAKWYQFDHHVMLGASSAFHLETLLKEIEETGIGDNLTIHPRAGVITQAHREAECVGEDSTKHLASTMQGCGTFLADKVLRRPNLKLARDYPELARYMPERFTRSQKAHEYKYCEAHDNMLHIVHNMLASGATFLHEGAQGFSLDISHGSHYPQCTSRGTTAIQNLADMGVSHKEVGDVYLVIRPYPIRVGNVVENGQTMGHSGGCYDDQREITWDQVCDEAGAPEEAKIAIRTKELTTVTKRLRRVFTMSPTQLREAVLANGATKIALNFANYIDWSVTGTNSYEQLTPKVREFIGWVEKITDVPVALVGTGPRICDVIFL